MLLAIEYRVDDFAGWKAIFDKDPMGRGEHGVISHVIYRDSDDDEHVMLSLEFASSEEARMFLSTLQPVWRVSGATQAWILQKAEP